MKNKPKITAIIVNWNGYKDTLVCLDSLKRVNCNTAQLEVIVVDNGSADESVSVLRKSHPWVEVLETGRNLGFTGGNNFGMKYAMKRRTDFIWMLNNDTYVDEHVLSFADVFADESVGACGSKIYFAPGHEYHLDRYTKSELGHVFWYAGGKVDWDNMYASHRGVDEVDTGQYDTISETPFITGCSFAIRTSLIENIGMLDDAYYLYLEDFDWSLRVNKAGYKTMYVPTSVLWHINAGSSGKPGNPTHEYYFTRNRLLVGFRYASFRTKFALVREAIKYVYSGSPVRRRAVIDAFTGKFGKQYDPKKHN